jgi:ubiquinone/menaquinone biosynthesis C-methylase UbiE
MRRPQLPIFLGCVVALPLILAVSAPLNAQDKSVRPGINKTFENPNVEEFIGKFEREGREPFDHRQQIVEACRVRSGMVVADIGTGTGLFARMFSPLVGPQGRVYAVDISDKFIKHVEATARKNNLTNIVGVVCPRDSVNLPPDSIDLALICDTYHHFEFPRKTMRSLHRALRSGGQVVLIDFHRIEGKSSDWIMNHVRAGQEVFTREIVESGFRQIEERKNLLKESYFVRFKKVAKADSSTDNQWTPFFDDKTLDGWTVRGGYAKYEADNRMIVGTTVEGSPNSFLCKGPFSDFLLEFDVLCDRKLNSGVQIRSHVYETGQRKGVVYGYQCEIAADHIKNCGNFWDEARLERWWDDFSHKPEARTAYKADQWNHYRIVAQGDHIRSWVNGIPCADFHDKTDATGFIGLQVHEIEKGTGPYQVRWKNLRIRELKPGEKAE